MAFMDASFMIDNASLEHDSTFVAETLIAIFGKDFIEQVREIIISPVGLPKYKKFYIFTITNDHPAFMRLLNLIVDWKCAVIVYNIELNPTTMEYVKHYWKIISAPVWKTFTPYLMSEAQMSEIMPYEPWAPEADAAFGPVKTYTEIDTDEEETLVLPPPMVRDNGGPYKLVRSINLPQEAEVKEEVNDEDYWTEYWKTHGPPPLVRQTDDQPVQEDTPLCAWKDLPPPPQLFDWATREGADKHHKTYE
jgi:hypothetical protein